MESVMNISTQLYVCMTMAIAYEKGITIFFPIIHNIAPLYITVSCFSSYSFYHRQIVSHEHLHLPEMQRSLEQIQTLE